MLLVDQEKMVEIEIEVLRFRVVTDIFPIVLVVHMVIPMAFKVVMMVVAWMILMELAYKAPLPLNLEDDAEMRAYSTTWAMQTKHDCHEYFIN